ncbi:MAG: hypothetical protein KDA21_03665 [Phycisphaerales bacterium]|nr:hypothetical protein [Phycisphaerales bacterium]
MSTDTTFLYLWLDSTDAHCPRCRYSLRGVRSRRCPECGLELVLDRREHFDWWAAGVFGLAIGAAADLFMLTTTVVVGLAGGHVLAPFVYLLVATLAAALALAHHIRNRGGPGPDESVRGRVIGLMTFTGLLSMAGMILLVVALL